MDEESKNSVMGETTILKVTHTVGMHKAYVLNTSLVSTSFHMTEN